VSYGPGMPGTTITATMRWLLALSLQDVVL
jgi:hypothetical protein